MSATTGGVPSRVSCNDRLNKQPVVVRAQWTGPHTTAGSGVSPRTQHGAENNGDTAINSVHHRLYLFAEVYSGTLVKEHVPMK